MANSQPGAEPPPEAPVPRWGWGEAPPYVSVGSAPMAIGIITGSGTYALPGFEGGEPEPVATRWGEALVSRGTFAGVDVAHVSRHGAGHVRLSNHVAHRANIAALRSSASTR